jgi:hypothetical protein
MFLKMVLNYWYLFFLDFIHRHCVFGSTDRGCLDWTDPTVQVSPQDGGRAPSKRSGFAKNTMTMDKVQKTHTSKLP